MTVLNLQVGASTDDAYERTPHTTMNLTFTTLDFGQLSLSRHIGIRFTGVSGLSGSSISAATLTFRAAATDGGRSSFIGDWYAHDAAAPGTFTTTLANISDTAQRPRTTATCEGDNGDFGNWTSGNDQSFTGDGTNTIIDIIQELADSYDPSTIVLLHIYTSGTGERRAKSYDSSSSLAPKLDITFTAGGGSLQTATPTPVVIEVSVPTPQLAMTPTPVVIEVAVPTPSVTGASIKFPTPVVIEVSVPTPTVTAGTVTITPSPVVIEVVVPTMVVTGTGAAEEFVQWGFVNRFVNPDQYASGIVFLIEVGMFTSSASVPVKARLFNITDDGVVSGSEVTTTETSFVVVRSGTFSLPSGLKKYRIEFGGQQGGVFSFHGGDALPVSAGS